MTVLSKDQEGFVKYLKAIFDASPGAVTDVQARTQRLNRIIDLVQDGNGKKPLEGFSTMTEYAGDYGGEYVIAAVVTVAYIAIIAVTYVLAASQVGVVLNVAAVATAWTKIAVWGYEPEYPEYYKGGASTSSVEENVRNMQRAAMAATLYGRKDLAVEAVKSTLNKEMDAMIGAAEQIGIIKLPSRKRKQIVDELKKLCREAVGIGA